MRNYSLDGEFKALSGVQTEQQNNLLTYDNVVGVGLSHKIKDGKDTGDACLTVFVQQKLDTEFIQSNQMIPKTFGKFKTDVVEIGYVEAQTTPTLNNRMRPFYGGFSIAHKSVTAGTAAALVIDKGAKVPAKYYVLSNCHVLANSGVNVLIGDPVVQPGPFDGGTVANDKVGKLSKFTPIVFSTLANNLVDCAIAELDELEYYGGEIYGIGYPKGIGNVAVGTAIQKTGRTTGYTRGSVTAINATVNVNFGSNGTARFINQIITTAMSSPGDSGSLVLDMNDNAVGLLFAGSNVATIINPISAVMNSLNIEFV
jgi:S1-C subfamily serine protease